MSCECIVKSVCVRFPCVPVCFHPVLIVIQSAGKSIWVRCNLQIAPRPYSSMPSASATLLSLPQYTWSHSHIVNGNTFFSFFSFFIFEFGWGKSVRFDSSLCGFASEWCDFNFIANKHSKHKTVMNNKMVCVSVRAPTSERNKNWFRMKWNNFNISLQNCAVQLGLHPLAREN